MPDPKKLVLIDGANYAFRAFHALPPLTNKAGQPTGALFGFAQLLARYLREDKPDYLAVIWDAPGPSFRKERYPDYKAQRKPMDPALRSQMPYFQTLAEAFNIPFISIPGVEADDVIATLALAHRGKVAVEILSTDKDLMQLVGDGVLMHDTIRGAIYDPAAVEAKWSVPPEKIRDLFAFMGDSSDNIPGVPGIGKKRAAGLMADYGSLDAVYQNLGDFKGKLRQNLEDYQELARLSRELVTLKTDVEVDLNLEALAPTEPDAERCRALFIELEFHRLLRAYGLEDAEAVADVSGVAKGAGAKDFLGALKGDEPLAFIALGGGFGRPPSHVAIAPVPEDASGEDPGPCQVLKVGEGIPWEGALKDALGAALAQDGKLVGYQIKADISALLKAGVEPQGGHLGVPLGDVLLSAYIVNSGAKSLKLEDLAATLLHIDISGDPDPTSEELPAQLGGRLTAIGRLYRHFEAELLALGQGRLLSEMELPLVPVLCQLEHTGIELDSAHLGAITEEIGGDLDRLHGEICDYASKPDFNPNSPKQLQVVLFEELGLPIIKRTKTGPSTNSSVLEALAEQHPLPAKILEYRSLAKLKNTYLDTLPTLVEPETGRIHTTLNQAVAATGRLSSSDPNLQNIPIRTALGRRIREAFVAPGGMKLMSADYSQVELRLMAHLSGDPILTEAFKAGQDIHSRTAAELYGLEKDAVPPELRRAAKAINFGILYGMGPHRLAQDLGIPQKEAKAFIEHYFERFSGVRAYLDGTIEQAKSQGFVETIYGRRRYLPEIKDRNFNVRANAERMATNAPLQGSAADIIKLAMVRIQARLETEAVEGRMLLQVHDELLFEVPEEGVDALQALVKAEMEGVAELSVPLLVEVGTGDNWAEAH